MKEFENCLEGFVKFWGTFEKWSLPNLQISKISENCFLNMQYIISGTRYQKHKNAELFFDTLQKNNLRTKYALKDSFLYLMSFYFTISNRTFIHANQNTRWDARTKPNISILTILLQLLCLLTSCEAVLAAAVITSFYVHWSFRYFTILFVSLSTSF